MPGFRFSDTEEFLGHLVVHCMDTEHGLEVHLAACTTCGEERILLNNPRMDHGQEFDLVRSTHYMLVLAEHMSSAPDGSELLGG